MSFLTVWRKEKWRITALAVFFSVSISASAALFFPNKPLTVAALTPRVQNVVDTVLTERRQDLLSTPSVPFGDASTVNILVLGIDSRKEGKEEHCDAIHMVSVNVVDWTVLVTSVPRGTYAYIPPGTWAENEYYLANACAFAGLEYGVEQIEHVVGTQADYVVTVGFSQVFGILRAIGMPTTESLQWLRHRQSYAIGDPQRSSNQAVFMKDVALRLLDGGIPDVVFHVLYSFVNTDMDYATAKTLFDGLSLHAIVDRPEDIVLTMKPHFDVKELHFDPENAGEQVAALVAKLQGRLSRADLSNATIEEIQASLVAYLEDALDDSDDIASIIDEELWLQVENTATRESLQYRFIDQYARDLLVSDADAAIQLVAHYILEKQTQGLLVWEKKGRTLLESIVTR